MNFLETVRKGQKVRAGGGIKTIAASGGYGGYGGGIYGLGFSDFEGIDYNKEAGLRWDSSLVYPLLSKLSSTVGSVPIMTARMVDGAPVPIPNHRITQLLEAPNDWYNGSLLETGSVFQEGSRGNSFVYKHRSGGRRLVALELLPDGSCYPYTAPGSGDWITEYRIFTANGYFAVPPQDILHLRWMTPNPLWLQMGMPPLDSCLADIVADKFAARHEAMLLKNGAVASLMVSPRVIPSKLGEDVEFELTDTQAEQLQRRIDSRLSGDMKGSSFVWNVPMEYKQLGFDPKQLALTDTRYMSESRVCAVFNIPPIVANFLVGLEKGNNRASYAAAVDQFFDDCATPYMRHRARQFTEDLVPELGEEGEVVIYDESKIPAMKSRLVRDLMERTGGPLETVNEGRAELGLKPVPDGDIVRSAGPAAGAKEPSDSRKTKNDTTEG